MVDFTLSASRSYPAVDPPLTVPSNKWIFADTLRGLAAALVVIDHMLNLAGHGIAAILPSVSFGQIGVGLFFIISGFVIPLSLSKYTWGGFLISRFFRIYPTYAAAFVVTAIVVISGGGVVTTLAYISHFLIATDLFGVPPIDPVIWTLQIEVKFYLLCVLCIPLLRAGAKSVLFVPVALFAVCLFVEKMPAGHPLYIALTPAMMIIFMFAGVAFFLHVRRSISTLQLCFAIPALFFATKYVWDNGPVAATSHLVWNYLFAAAVFGLSYFLRSRFKANRFFSFMSSISYPLYVVHLPILLISIKIGPQYDVSTSISSFLGAAVAVVAAYAIHKFVESPSQRFGKYLARRVGGETTLSDRQWTRTRIAE